MVKTPNVRHSKARKDPVTIDLDASRLPSDGGVTPPIDAATSSEPVGSPLIAEVSEATPEKEAILEGEGFTMANPADLSDRVKADDVTASNEAATTNTTAKGNGAAGSAARDPGKQTSGSSRNAADAPAASTGARRGSGLSAVAAGIIGGVITLLGAGAFQYSGVLPSPNAGGEPAAIEGLRTEIADLQTELAALKSGGDAGGVSQTVADLQARVESLATDLGTLRTAVETGGAGENAGLAALDAKVAGLQTEIARLGQASGGAPVDLAPLNDRLAALETGIKAITDAAAAGDTRLATLEQTVATLAGKVDAQANQPKIALSIASSALKAAIDRGQPFAAELETLAAISPNLPQLAALRTHAEAGVATRDDLMAGMDAAANAMIEAGKPVDPNADYLDQLLESAASLVTVRPVGAIEGAGAPETVARMEAALKAGDLAKAFAEYETLPEPAKAAGASFAGKIKARLDVETLADQAIAEAMKTA